MLPFRSLSWSARLYLALVICIGVAMVPLGWYLRPVGPDQIGTLLYLAVFTQIAALRPIPWKNGTQFVYDPLLIATGLFAPGAGVGIVSWLALFDGRVPGRNFTWWAFLFNRAMPATAHVLPSILVAKIGHGTWWGLPAQTVVYVAVSISLNYAITALGMAYVRRVSFWATVAQNVGLPTLAATLVLNFSGGILYLLLQAQPFPVGYVVAPGLFGFVLAVRSTIADVQRQTVLKDQTLDLAAQALDARDRYTESHSIRVADLAGRLGEQLELADHECELIRTAASLHDLGKIGIRDDILNKPGPLSEEEWEIMRRHPDIGADMVAQHSALRDVAPLVRHHHERWDGTGYPMGLKGETIPFGARILSVADSFDTITGPRLYRQSLMTPIEGVEDISLHASTWYDPNVVDALRELHGLKPLELGNRSEVPRRVTTIRVLRANPSFSKLITAMGISALGDPLTQVATLVSIYLKTGDPRLVALGLIVQALGTVIMSAALGGIGDKVSRRNLIVVLELTRAAILICTPFAIAFRWWIIIPILFGLSLINAVVQPVRQAAVPNLVPAGQVGKANAMVAATTMLAGAIGFAASGGLLALYPTKTSWLFIGDAMTFVIAAAIVVGIPSLGGGMATTSMSGALRRSWMTVAARPQLVMGVLAAFLIPISFPALLALAYAHGGPVYGGQTYSTLELLLSLGVLAGTFVVARLRSIGSLSTVGLGLLLTGAFSVVIAMSPSLPLLAVALFIASVGNPIYTVANQTALVEAADPSNRSSLMATRFGLTQTAGIVGMAIGGVVTREAGAAAAYGVLGVGLVLLAMYAIAAGRSTVNPLHGEKYQEAMQTPEPTTSPNGREPPPTSPPRGTPPPSSTAPPVEQPSQSRTESPAGARGKS